MCVCFSSKFLIKFLVASCSAVCELGVGIICSLRNTFSHGESLLSFLMEVGRLVQVDENLALRNCLASVSFYEYFLFSDRLPLLVSQTFPASQEHSVTASLIEISLSELMQYYMWKNSTVLSCAFKSERNSFLLKNMQGSGNCHHMRLKNMLYHKDFDFLEYGTLWGWPGACLVLGFELGYPLFIVVGFFISKSSSSSISHSSNLPSLRPPDMCSCPKSGFMCGAKSALLHAAEEKKKSQTFIVHWSPCFFIFTCISSWASCDL